MNTLKGKNIFLRALELEDFNYLFSIENNDKYWSISDSQIPFSNYLLNRYLKNSESESISMTSDLLSKVSKGFSIVNL